MAIEDHLRHLDSGYKSEDASCLVKHALQLREQSLEGISHANEVGDKEKVKAFRDLERGAEALRMRFSQRVDPDTLILEVRQLRKRAEVLDPSFNLEKCKSCGNAENFLEELKDVDHGVDLDRLERDMAEKVLNSLSEKYAVEPPKLEVDSRCHEPSEAHYQNGKIRMCRGGISEHTILHEFKHYLDDLGGKQLSEGDAEAFAVVTVDKGLNPKGANHSVSEDKMKISAQTKEVLTDIVGVNVGYGVGYAAKAYLDPAVPAIMGQNPSLYVDTLGTLGLALYAWKTKKPTHRMIAALAAAGLSTYLWNDAKAALGGTLAAKATSVVVSSVQGYPVVGTRAVGESNPQIPAWPTAAPRMGASFASPVVVGPTMSPGHYTLDGSSGIQNVVMGPKYMLA